MIHTVTPNPGFDHTYLVPTLELGEIARAHHVTIEAAGKGVNVARNAAANGQPARAIVPGNATDGAAFRTELEGFGVGCRIVERPDPTRRNITIIGDDGNHAKVNEGGAVVVDALVDALIEGVDAGPDDLVAGCGSLAPGTDPGFYARLAAALPAPADQLALDTSGEPLRQCLDVPCLITKPNREELEELLDTRFETYGDLVDACRSLNARGWSNVLVSLGPAGAVLVNDAGAWAGDAPTDTVINTVGAGDSLLTGYLCDPSSPEAGLRSALAFARASVRSALTAGAIVSDADHASVRLRSVVATESLGEETG